jgi:hypothetical protein
MRFTGSGFRLKLRGCCSIPANMVTYPRRETLPYLFDQTQSLVEQSPDVLQREMSERS